MPVQKSKKLEPKVKLLKNKFADMVAGERMAIGTPEMIASLIKSIPKGKELSLSELRKKIAKKLDADVACPVTTAMYLKVTIEAEVKKQKARFSFPFWRVASEDSKIFAKLSLPAKRIIRSRRASEGLFR